MKNILILGSTGSVGESTLKVIEENKDSFRLIGMSFHRNSARAIEIIEKYAPDFVYTNIEAVSYTHLTLPTILLV